MVHMQQPKIRGVAIAEEENILSIGQKGRGFYSVRQSDVNRKVFEDHLEVEPRLRTGAELMDGQSVEDLWKGSGYSNSAHLVSNLGPERISTATPAASLLTRNYDSAANPSTTFFGRSRRFYTTATVSEYVRG